MSRLRVAHVVTVPDSLIFLRGQAGYMRSNGVELSVISSPGASLTTFSDEEGVAAYGISMSRRISPVADCRALLALIRLLRDLRPDILHAHTPKAGLLGMLASFITGVPVRLYQLHGLPFETASGLKRSILVLSDRLAFALAHEILCVSRSLRDVVVSKGMARAEKVTVLLAGSINGVDTTHRFNMNRWESSRELLRSKLGIPVSSRCLGYVGRISVDKGVVELLEAWLTLRTTYPDLHLLVVGRVEGSSKLLSLAMNRCRRDPRVHVIDHVDDVAPYYLLLNVLVLPSHREGFGLVALEAGAMGVPVVATNVTGLVDAVCHGVTGQLVPSGSVSELSAAISSYLDDFELSRSHGEAAQSRARKLFEPASMWDAILEKYRQHSSTQP